MLKKNFKVSFYMTTALKVFTIPIALIIAQLLSRAVSLATSGNVSAAIADSSLALAMTVVTVAIEISCNIAIRKRNSRAMNQCKLDLLGSLLKNPLHRLYNIDHGELMENLNDDITAATNQFTKTYPALIASALTGIGYAVFLFIQSPLIAASLLGISVLQLIPPVIVKKHMQINYEDCREIEAKITDHMIEAVEGFETIKLYDLKSWWLGKMEDFHKTYLKVGKKSEATMVAQRSMYKMLDNILKYGTYALVGIYAILGYCTMEVALQGIILSGELFDAVKSFFSSVPAIAISRSAEKRLNKWVYPEVSGKEVPCGDQSILSNVCCKYGDNLVLSGINCQFDLTKNYLFEGKNGAGKSTLLNLLSGVILPDSGEVLIGGVHPARFSEDVYPQIVLCIPQIDPEFDFNVNTLYGMFHEDRREDIYKIARRFGLSEERMNTCGIRDLSGGERKKVFLSIGFAMNPPILLLDEPTNSLDDQGRLVLEELIKERRGGTFIISHDPSYKEMVDSVYIVENGGVRRATT